MGKLYIFRGKAATGKSLITDSLSEQLKICVFRKDDVYDALSNTIEDHSVKNRLSYDVLAKLINTNIQSHCEVIVDIGLANSVHFNTFLSKLNLDNSKVKCFLCICSDEQVWRERMAERVKNPTPNQLFKSVDEAVSYYQESEHLPLKDEFVIDSAEDLSDILKIVKAELNV